MNAHERMRSLIRGIYAAAADETRWASTLELLGDEFGGGVCGLQFRTGPEGHVRSARFVRVDPALYQIMLTRHARNNPWVRATQPRYAPGDVVALQHVVPLPELQRTDYYNEVLRPLGVIHAFGSCVFREGEDTLSFTVVRSKRRAPFDQAELTRVPPLLPHIHRAVQVNARLSQLQRIQTGLADGLDLIRHGVVIVNRSGRVIFANRAARAILAQRDGLTIDADGLAASVQRDRLTLRSLIDDAVRTSMGEGFGSGGAMRVGRPSLKRPFTVLVAPFRAELDIAHPAGLAAVFISDQEARVETADEIVRRVYGLSATEARVAHSLVATGSVERAAEEVGISRETARWHLKRIYRKTSTHRQAALVRCLVNGPWRLAVDAPPASGSSRT